MIPVSDVLIFGVVGLSIAVLARFHRGFARWTAWRLPVGLALLTLLLTIEGLYAIAGVILACGLAASIGPWLERRAAGFGRLVRVSFPALAVGLVVLTGLTYERVTSAEHRALVPSPAREARRAQRAVDRARRRPRRESESSRARPPDHAEPGTAGAQRRRLLGGPLDGPVDLAVSRQHDDRPLAPRAFRGAGPAARRDVPDPGRGPGTGRVCHRRVRRQHPLLQRPLRHGPGIRPVRGRLRESERLAVRDGPELRPGERVFRLSVTRYRAASGRRRSGKRRRCSIATSSAGSRGQPAGQPFFVFINYYDAHTPYIFSGDPDLRFGMAALPFAEHVEIDKRFWDLAAGKPNPAGFTTQQIISEGYALFQDSYESCIAYLDRQVGLLLDEIDRRGLLENTLVIVTSDHGEHFGERGLMGHGVSLYRREVHVPLVVVPPRRSSTARIVDEPVSNREIPATVAEWVDLGPRNPFPGRSLTRFLTDSAERLTEPSPVLCEVQHIETGPPRPEIPATVGPVRSLVTRDRVYIRNAGGREELYDRVHDDWEAVDLAGHPHSHRDIDRLRKELCRLSPCPHHHGSPSSGPVRPRRGHGNIGSARLRPNISADWNPSA